MTLRAARAEKDSKMPISLHCVRPYKTCHATGMCGYKFVLQSHVL